MIKHSFSYSGGDKRNRSYYKCRKCGFEIGSWEIGKAKKERCKTKLERLIK